MNASEPIDFHTAFLAAQKEMRDPVKDSTNPHFKSKFVSLKCLLDAVRGPLHKHGLGISQAIDFEMTPTGPVSFVRTRILGTDLESRHLILCAKPNDPQAMGSAIKYARRYALEALVGAAAADEEDDDGESATDRSKPASAKPAKNGADTFGVVEEAIAAIEACKDKQALLALNAKIEASHFSGEDKARGAAAWKARADEINKQLKTAGASK